MNKKDWYTHTHTHTYTYTVPTLEYYSNRKKNKEIPFTAIWMNPQFSSLQSLSHVLLFLTPWTVAHQASLSITNSQSLPKLMFIESVMASNHLILCHPLTFLQSFPASGSFSMSQFFTSGGQSMRVSASASVLPVNIQD